MKLRMKGNSIRLRITPSEMKRLLESGRLEEAVWLGWGPECVLTYVLQREDNAESIAVRYKSPEILVVVSNSMVEEWAKSTEEGIYGQIETGAGPLDVAIEKDFACLDKSDTENIDTFPNPIEGAVC